MQLTKEQQRIFDAVLAGVRRGEPIQTVGGYAGTGKSVLVSRLADALPGFLVCTPTGKAAEVLRRKGVARARTIHSAIYHAEEVEVIEEVTGPDGRKEKVVRYEPVFYRREFLELDGTLADGVIIDEASMVNAEVLGDLSSYGLPLVCVGDHGQLPPVGEDPGLMRDLDHRLETVHRNAGEIAHFGEYLRGGKPAYGWSKLSGTGRDVRFVGPERVVESLRSGGQAIAGFNKMRVETNRRFRSEVLGRTDNTIVPDDRLICLKNSRRWPLFNGSMMTVLESPGENRLKVRTEAGSVLDIEYTDVALNQPKPDLTGLKGDAVPLDFAFCVTAHKAQGSEWDAGIVLEQRCPLWEHHRWAYTAATRFKKALLWTNPRWAKHSRQHAGQHAA